MAKLKYRPPAPRTIPDGTKWVWSGKIGWQLHVLPHHHGLLFGVKQPARPHWLHAHPAGYTWWYNGHAWVELWVGD